MNDSPESSTGCSRAILTPESTQGSFAQGDELQWERGANAHEHISIFSEYNDVSYTSIPSPDVLHLHTAPEFNLVFSLLYAMERSDELTTRAHKLTTEAIKLNATSPTAWMYRRRIVRKLQTTQPTIWSSELAFTAVVLRDSRKNYQAWEHRRYCVQQSNGFDCESDFVDVALDFDAKNYHAWAHRAWLVRHGVLKGQLECSEWFIRADVRNNSAWNFRWVVTAKLGREAEANFACEMASLAPRNESVWNYLLALKRIGVDISKAREYAQHCLTIDAGCVPARRFLVCTATKEDAEQTVEHCTLLANGIDDIRKQYWLQKRKAPTKMIRHKTWE